MLKPEAAKLSLIVDDSHNQIEVFCLNLKKNFIGWGYHLPPSTSVSSGSNL